MSTSANPDSSNRCFACCYNTYKLHLFKPEKQMKAKAEVLL